MITRYTNPPISLLVEGTDITASDVYVTIKQGSTEITLTGARLTKSFDEDTLITFSLTQEEAGSLNGDKFCEVQVNYVSGGVRYATEIARARVNENLYDEVI